MKENAKAVVLSVLFIVAVAVFGVFLTTTASAPNERPVVAAQPEGGGAPAGSGQPAVRNRTATVAPSVAAAAAAEKRAMEGRLSFANHLERRYRARELPLSVRVTGEDQLVFTFQWTLEPNPDQLRQMRHAEPLWDELKSLGFRRVEMLDRQATKLLWYKDL